MSSRYEIIQANVLRILEPAALGDRASRIWDISLFGLVVLNLIAVALESVPTFQLSYGAGITVQIEYRVEQSTSRSLDRVMLIVSHTY